MSPTARLQRVVDRLELRPTDHVVEVAPGHVAGGVLVAVRR